MNIEERPVKDILDALLKLPLIPSYRVSRTDLRDKIMMMMMKKIKRIMVRRIMMLVSSHRVPRTDLHNKMMMMKKKRMRLMKRMRMRMMKYPTRSQGLT